MEPHLPLSHSEMHRASNAPKNAIPDGNAYQHVHNGTNLIGFSGHSHPSQYPASRHPSLSFPYKPDPSVQRPLPPHAQLQNHYSHLSPASPRSLEYSDGAQASSSAQAQSQSGQCYSPFHSQVIVLVRCFRAACFRAGAVAVDSAKL